MKNQEHNNAIVAIPAIGLEAAEKSFLQFLMKGGGQAYGLSYEKFVGRSNSARIAEDFPRKFVFSVERHRSIAGASYVKGAPMAAYETYLQEFLFDPESKEMVELEDVSVGYGINVYQLAEEQMREYVPDVTVIGGDSDKRRVSLFITKWKIETSSREEARSALEKEIRSLDHEFSFEYLEMSEDQKSDYARRLEDCCVEIVLHSFERAWEHPDLPDED